ncbi:MAG TPA: hypothetical protein VHM70_28360 [Polyangiaceae bacterium]|nr:hypothetical protein [Polyangiaceae bacterium]
MQPKLLVGLLWCLPLVSCGQREDEDSGATCEALCARSIKCPNDPDTQCVAQCTQVQKACPTQAKPYLECAIALPDSKLACDPLGHTNLGPGACEAEDLAVSQCIRSAPSSSQ